MLPREAGTGRLKALDRLIDDALLDPRGGHLSGCAEAALWMGTEPLAERVRRRAAWLARRQATLSRAVHEARDTVIMGLYAAAAGPQWAVAWCDGSTVTANSHRCSTVACILMSPQRHVTARLSRFVGDRPPFETEIAAVALAMDAALSAGFTRLWVYSDCPALIDLWLRRRRDPRLDQVRHRAGDFRRFALRPIRRLHNQPAHHLARRARP